MNTVNRSQSVSKTTRLIWFAYFVALTVWGLLSYASLVQFLQENRLFALSMDGRPYVCDFVNSYNAALLAGRAGRDGVAIYDPKVQAESLARLVHPVVPELPFYLQYPPYFWVIMRPLAWFDLTGAWLAYCLVTGLFLLAALFVLVARKLDGQAARAMAMAAVLASYPAWLSFRLGQVSLLVFPLLALYWIMLASRRSGWAGAAAAIMCIKLQYAPVLLVVGVIVGRLGFLTGFASTMLTMVAVSIVTLGWANVSVYPSALLAGETSARVSGVQAVLMQNVRGALELVTGGGGNLVTGTSVLALVVVAIWVACVWLRIVRSGRDAAAFEQGASLTTLALLVSSLHTHVQDYLMAAIPCLWLYASSSSANGIWREGKVLRALIIAFPALSWVFFLLTPLFLLARIQPYFLWAVVVMYLAYRLLERRLKSAADSPT
ncbi:MAG TPA: glycosyltransferase family 87 protein [Candidatus Obscuribacterales bacterium]